MESLVASVQGLIGFPKGTHWWVLAPDTLQAGGLTVGHSR